MSFDSKSLPPPTEEEAARMAFIKVCGCIACGRPGVEVHHLLVGGLRVGHRYTIGLCRWCHQGYPPRGAGPSLRHESKRFHEVYGSDQELLDKQDDMMGYAHVVIPGRREKWQ